MLCDIFVEYDVVIFVRDGVIFYVDVLCLLEFLFGDNDKVLVFICWFLFGKKFNGIEFFRYMILWVFGLILDVLLGLEKFEVLDLVDWVFWGYVIVNVDFWGFGDSGGIMVIMG